MSLKGGYQIIDLSNYPLKDTSYTKIPGFHDTINYCSKPIIISGLTHNGQVFSDFELPPHIVGEVDNGFIFGVNMFGGYAEFTLSGDELRYGSP